MAKFNDDFEAIEIDTEKDEADLISLYKEKSGLNVYPAQSAKILISIIAYAKSLVLLKINECVKNLLLPYARRIWLDILGYLMGCERLIASRAVSKLKVILYEKFSFDKTLPKGAKCETIDGVFFETTEDLVIPAGETVGYVDIQSVDAGSALNYKKGEINSLVENYEFIESVENTEDCTGGADEEDDDSYRERIATAAERFSVAGPEGAYKYYIRLAHRDIVDCAVEQPNDDVYIVIDDDKYIEESGNITMPGNMADVDYNACSVTLPAGTYDKPIKIVFPRQAEINCYVLTKAGKASEEILKEVEKVVSADDIKPLCDYVKYFSAIEYPFTVEPTVYIDNDADFNTVVKNVKKVLNDYFADLKLKLNQSVLASTLIQLIKNVEGVCDVKLNKFEDIEGKKEVFCTGSLGDGTKFIREGNK